MYNIVTVSDINYLSKGIAMVDSLQSETDWIYVMYICLDKDMVRILQQYPFSAGETRKIIIPVFVEDIPELRNFDNRTHQDYCWSLSARGVRCLANWFGRPTEIVYLDSDLYFYKSIDLLFSEARKGNYRLGLIPHCHISKYAGPGGYNCGAVYFNNAYKAIDIWVDTLFHPEKYPNPQEYEKMHGVKFDMFACGDQTPLVYLDDRFGGNTFHTFLTGAPWVGHICKWDRLFTDGSMYLCNLTDTTANFVRDYQPMLYWHFSGFDLKSYPATATRERYNEEFMQNQEVRKLYDAYMINQDFISKVIQNL